MKLSTHLDQGSAKLLGPRCNMDWALLELDIPNFLLLVWIVYFNTIWLLLLDFDDIEENSLCACVFKCKRPSYLMRKGSVKTFQISKY